MLTPGRVGEISKVYLLSENDKNKYSLITNIMLFEIIMDFVCIVFISLIFSVLFIKNTIFSIILFFLFIISFIFLFISIKFNKLLNILPNKINFFFKDLNNLNINLFYKWYLNITLTFGAWFLDGVFQFYLLKSISNDNNIIILVSLSAINSVISVISILPLGFGISDVSSIFFYKNFAYLSNEQTLFLINSTRLFIIISLILMSIPFLKFLLGINLESFKRNSNI